MTGREKFYIVFAWVSCQLPEKDNNVFQMPIVSSALMVDRLYSVYRLGNHCRLVLATIAVGFKVYPKSRTILGVQIYTERKRMV